MSGSKGLMRVAASVLCAGAILCGAAWLDAYGDESAAREAEVRAEAALESPVFAGSDGSQDVQVLLEATNLAPTSFAVDAAGLGSQTQVTSSTLDGESWLFLPSAADLSALPLQFSCQDGSLTAYVSTSLNGRYELVSSGTDLDVAGGGFSQDENGAYTLYFRAAPGDNASVLHIMASANVKSMYMVSDDPINKGRAYVESSEDHALSVSGSMVLTDAQGSVVYDGGLTQIKGRGNSTWVADKKPYQIKTSSKVALVSGAQASKTWLLLANYFDSTDLRNYIALNMGYDAGLGETPQCEFVDLYYDGEYRGLYLLTEKIQVGDGRVQIHDLEGDNEDVNEDASALPVAQAENAYGQMFQYVDGMVDPADITGGYLVEKDEAYYLGERSWFMTTDGPFVIKSPENASYEQVKYISEYFQRAIDEAGQQDGDLSRYFDAENLARTLLVESFGLNTDWPNYSSTYYYKDQGDDIIYAGPIWDFDLGFGMHGFLWRDDHRWDSPTEWYSEPTAFYFDNAQFQQALGEVYARDVLPQVNELLGREDASETLTLPVADAMMRYAAARTMNQVLWGNDYQYYSDDEFVTWMRARAGWMAEVYLGVRVEEIPEQCYTGEVCEPAVTVTMDGRTLVEGLDYTLTYANNVNAGTAQVKVVGRGAFDATIMTTFEIVKPVVRLAGSSALDTMEQIVTAGFADQSCSAVVVATFEGYWDSLTASGLAGALECPVLMTRGASLSAQTAREIERLTSPQGITVYVAGGENAVSPYVVETLQSYGFVNEVVRVAGDDALGTSVAMYEQARAVLGDTCIIATAGGYWDALSMAPYAWMSKSPVFLAGRGEESLSESVHDAIAFGGFRQVIIAGGPMAVSAGIQEEVAAIVGADNVVRLYGSTAAATSVAIAEYCVQQGMTSGNVGFATIDGYYDALTAAAFCGKNAAPILLVSDTQTAGLTDFVHPRKAEVSQAFVFGGPSAVSDDLFTAIKQAIG